MLEEEAREYHAAGRPGKIAVAITKPCATQHDLALAYTPGVAVPVRDISRTRWRRSATPPAGTWWPSSPTAPPSSAWATSGRSPASR